MAVPWTAHLQAGVHETEKTARLRVMIVWRLLVAALALGVLPSPACAEDDGDTSPLHWEIAAVSDYLFRGISQTEGKPTLQGGLLYASGQGWYAGCWASGVDFGEGGPRLEVDWTLGHARDLGPSAAIDVSLNRYSFPGASALDYNEWLVSLTVLDDYSLTLGYSNDVWNTGTTGLYYAAEAQWALANDFTLSAGVGRNLFRDSAATEARSYTDWNLRIARQFGAAEITLGYYGTDGRARVDFGRTANSRVVLMVRFER